MLRVSKKWSKGSRCCEILREFAHDKTVREQVVYLVGASGSSQNTTGKFQTLMIEPGIAFSYLPEAKWKTLSINVFCKLPVIEDRLTALALVPRLARRGTAGLPTLQALSSFLEDMYGAGMGADARKVGPIQVIRFGIDIPSPEYLNAVESGMPNSSIISRALSFIWDVVTRPYLEGGAYPQNVFDIERNEHRRDIIGMINNRPSYAAVRLVEEISRGDPRGLPAWGSLEDLDSVGPKTTWKIWQEALSQCPISIYAVGQGADTIGDLLGNGRLDFPLGRSKEIWDIGKQLQPPPLPQDVLRVEDCLPGAQTILCMAFHTGICEGDPKLPALLFCDGVLGGFPHSKLFSVVREKEGLAYFADTSPNTWRGLIMAIAGISDENKERVERLILQQVETVRKGEISDQEMESTRIGLIRRLRTESDSQSSLIRRLLTHEILGGAPSEEDIVQGILKVTKQDVVDVASQAELKAVYALRAKGDDTIGP